MSMFTSLLSIISLLLCFAFGYLALANLVVSYNLRRERLNRYRWLDSLHSSWSSKPPISYL